jgi:hypothetical protein
MGADLSIFGRTEAGKPLECAQPFARAATVLRAADALVVRRPLRRSRMPAGLLAAANRAQDEELRLISQELRHAVKILLSAVEHDSPSPPRR